MTLYNNIIIIMTKYKIYIQVHDIVVPNNLHTGNTIMTLILSWRSLSGEVLEVEAILWSCMSMVLRPTSILGLHAATVM